MTLFFNSHTLFSSQDDFFCLSTGVKLKNDEILRLILRKWKWRNLIWFERVKKKLIASTSLVTLQIWNIINGYQAKLILIGWYLLMISVKFLIKVLFKLKISTRIFYTNVLHECLAIYLYIVKIIVKKVFVQHEWFTRMFYTNVIHLYLYILYI